MLNVMIGKYVIVRCRDAGVHAVVLECRRRLRLRRRFLSGVANHGLDSVSKVGILCWPKFEEAETQALP